ncbi:MULTISPECIES: SusC/RagA family TonB-linked outer membrane protein [Flavobacteriaceae]|uniref:SusC/RagA family TonB-linked outer membrane protein n=1 Tax=Flavobacteriaceae TaxID=49546 RepID=UPI001491ABEA|nr:MULTISPECIES: SusC/RagA family TonB-linked outer membrane protein [Allomuricauda]MDC6366698.1 SusC/RagA family TonB-linked outer membrane protein [Muricauda sp. AC10]
MKQKIGFLSMVFVLLLSGQMFGQEKSITGTVTDSENVPLPGVNIVVEGTSNGTQTDFDGNYTIGASEGNTLLFTYIGQKDVRLVVGTDRVINVQMEEDAQALEEVVVTAQGVKQEKKALGYSVASVSSDEIESRADTDIGKILRGKAAGVRITGTGGVSGSGSNIIIRGASSITGNNQPLFVVDGIPFDASSNVANQGTATGNTSGAFQSGNVASRFADLDPNNIESVSILKGLSATAIYGSAGRNGVILITTKSGAGGSNKKFEVTINQSFFFNNIVLPKYQNTWGNGFQNVYGAFFSNWGARFDSQATIDNGFRTSILNNFGVEPSALFPGRTDLDNPNVVYRPYDSQRAFFKTGSINTTSINASGSFEKGNFGVSFANTEDDGFIPNNRLIRNNLSVGGSYKFDNKLQVTAKLNYARTDIKSPFTDASTGSDVTSSTAGTGGIASVWNILYLPRSVDITQPFQHPITGESIWYRAGNDRTNPAWVLENTKDANNTHRVFGNFNLNYQATDWLNLTWRTTIDNSTTNTERSINKGSNDGLHPNGYLQTTAQRNTIWDHTLFAAVDKTLSKKLSLVSTIGATTRRIEFERSGNESRDQIVFGLQNHGNYVNHSPILEGTVFPSNTVTYQRYSESNNPAIYATATLDYDGYFFLTGNARNDWFSGLEKNNRSQFSWGTAISFIPTLAFPGIRSEKGLNYMKIRASFGSAPGFPGLYRTRNILNLNPAQFQSLGGTTTTTTSVDNLLANSDLKPELSKEYEVGIEARFFNSRLGFDFTYYDRETKDQIIDRPLPPESGFTGTTVNVGNVSNKGIELSFDGIPLQTEDFTWSINGNYTINESLVSGLQEGEQIFVGGLFATPSNQAINGMPLGVILGSAILRDDEGNKLINENGYWIQDPVNQIIGDPNPDWFMTLGSTIRYKDFSLGMQWEYQHGGDILATTVASIVGRGLVEDTDFDRTQGIILPGIRQSTGLPNDIQLTATEAYFNNIGFGTDEPTVYDATHLRLREASLAYSMPSKFLDKTPFGSVIISLVGQNLWVKSFNTPSSVRYDPELNSLGVGNSQGLDYLTSWNSRRYGLNLKLTF